LAYPGGLFEGGGANLRGGAYSNIYSIYTIYIITEDGKKL